jgi:hypothetical protein
MFLRKNEVSKHEKTLGIAWIKKTKLKLLCGIFRGGSFWDHMILVEKSRKSNELVVGVRGIMSWLCDPTIIRECPLSMKDG